MRRPAAPAIPGCHFCLKKRRPPKVMDGMCNLADWRHSKIKSAPPAGVQGERVSYTNHLSYFKEPNKILSCTAGSVKVKKSSDFFSLFQKIVFFVFFLVLIFFIIDDVAVQIFYEHINVRCFIDVIVIISCIKIKIDNR